MSGVTYCGFTPALVGRGLSVRFDWKPGEQIRTAMKAQGFRWDGRAGAWFRPHVGQYADLFAWMDRKMREEKAEACDRSRELESPACR